MDVTSILGWLVAHVGDLLEIAGAVVGVASLVTGLTASPKDDSIVATVRGVLDRLSILVHHDAVGTLKVPGTASKAPE